MTLWVLQISDLHFGQPAPPFDPEGALDSVAAAVMDVLRTSAAPLVVALCGDVIHAGDPSFYDTAARVLERHLLKPLGMPQVACCPGNHDVVTDDKGAFGAFNRFAFRVSNNADVVFDATRSVTTTQLHGYQFVLANSMFRGHRDRSRGQLEIDPLTAALTAGPAEPRILITHHSLISDQPADRSTMANSYPVLRLATSTRVLAVLHGHMHAQMVLTLGKHATAMVGVGSLLYRPFPNYNNGFNMLFFEGSLLSEAIAFRYVADSISGPEVRAFERTALPIL